MPQRICAKCLQDQDPQPEFRDVLMNPTPSEQSEMQSTSIDAVFNVQCDLQTPGVCVDKPAQYAIDE